MFKMKFQGILLSMNMSTMLWNCKPFTEIVMVLSVKPWCFILFSLASRLQNPMGYHRFFSPFFNTCNLFMYLPYFPPLFLLGCVKNLGNQDFCLGKTKY